MALLIPEELQFIFSAEQSNAMACADVSMRENKAHMTHFLFVLSPGIFTFKFASSLAFWVDIITVLGHLEQALPFNTAAF